MFKLLLIGVFIVFNLNAYSQEDSTYHRAFSFYGTLSIPLSHKIVTSAGIYYVIGFKSKATVMDPHVRFDMNVSFIHDTFNLAFVMFKPVLLFPIKKFQFSGFRFGVYPGIGYPFVLEPKIPSNFIYSVGTSFEYVKWIKGVNDEIGFSLKYGYMIMPTYFDMHLISLGVFYTFGPEDVGPLIHRYIYRFGVN